MKYKGIKANKSSITISFTYQGVRCSETIKVRPTATAMKAMARKREAILYEIDTGNFCYVEHFPNSKKGKTHFATKIADNSTVGDWINKWYSLRYRQIARSTDRDYISAINFHLMPQFGSLKLSQLKPSIVKEWLSSLPISAKRKNNIIIPLRGATRLAYEDEILDSDPMDRIRNEKLSTKEPNPFSEKEINLILEQLSGSEKNLIQFAFFSGLRTSELIALTWDDYDIHSQQICVDKAIVRGDLKSTKTSSGIRQVDLHDKAIEALEEQWNIRKGELIFYESITGKPWRGDGFIRKNVWKHALRKASIPYRNPYQTRHTYASLMLSSNKNPLWVAKQLGHKDWGMIRKVYGKWIKPMT